MQEMFLSTHSCQSCLTHGYFHIVSSNDVKTLLMILKDEITFYNYIKFLTECLPILVIEPTLKA